MAVTQAQEAQLQEIQGEIAKSHEAEIAKLETQVQVLEMDRERLDREVSCVAQV